MLRPHRMRATETAARPFAKGGTVAIRQFEDLLGTRLLFRHASGVSLTHEGGRFLPQARAIAAAVAEAMRVRSDPEDRRLKERRVDIVHGQSSVPPPQPGLECRAERSHAGRCSHRSTSPSEVFPQTPAP